MRATYQDQVSHNFIEGPIQSKPIESSLPDGAAEKQAYDADLTRGYEWKEGDEYINISNSDPNERYD